MNEGEGIGMVAKNTQEKKIIQTIGLLYGVKYDGKTFENIKKLLICYREYVYGQDIFDFTIIKDIDMNDVVPQVYREFISTKEISDTLVNLLVLQVINNEVANNIMKKTIKEIKRFKKIGDDYCYILEKLFFSNARNSNTDIYLDLDYSPAQYSYRKEEAIMLFGIYFWHECMKVWADRETEMPQIMKDMDRYDLLPIINVR